MVSFQKTASAYCWQNLRLAGTNKILYTVRGSDWSSSRKTRSQPLSSLLSTHLKCQTHRTTKHYLDLSKFRTLDEYRQISSNPLRFLGPNSPEPKSPMFLNSFYPSMDISPRDTDRDAMLFVDPTHALLDHRRNEKAASVQPRPRTGKFTLFCGGDSGTPATPQLCKAGHRDLDHHSGAQVAAWMTLMNSYSKYAPKKSRTNKGGENLSKHWIHLIYPLFDILTKCWLLKHQNIVLSRSLPLKLGRSISIFHSNQRFLHKLGKYELGILFRNLANQLQRFNLECSLQDVVLFRFYRGNFVI